MAVKHDLIFFENRSTPKVVAKGMPFRGHSLYGKQTKRRAATEEEEKQIINGEWVRVDEKGNKGGQPGYKKTQMKGREHLVHELINELTHYGVFGMRKGVRKEDQRTVQDASYRPDNIAPAKPKPKPIVKQPGAVTVKDVGASSRISFNINASFMRRPNKKTKRRMQRAQAFQAHIFRAGGSIRSISRSGSAPIARVSANNTYPVKY